MVDESFVDTTPTGPDSGAESTELTDGDKKSPYTLTVSLLTRDASEVSPMSLGDIFPISAMVAL